MTAKINDAIILLGRLSISALFLQAGVGKLFEIFGFAGSLAAKGVPFSGLVVYLVILVEILGAAALIFGVRARETGAILLAFTYVATLLSHAGRGALCPAGAILQESGYRWGPVFVFRDGALAGIVRGSGRSSQS